MGTVTQAFVMATPIFCRSVHIKLVREEGVCCVLKLFVFQIY